MYAACAEGMERPSRRAAIAGRLFWPIFSSADRRGSSAPSQRRWNTIEVERFWLKFFLNVGALLTPTSPELHFLFFLTF